MLDLSKTRLRSAHLRVLCPALRRAPQLQTVMLVQVALLDEFSHLDHTNPLLAAMADDQCQVLRLEVSIAEYPNLWKAIFAAKRQRQRHRVSGDVSSGKGRGKGKARNQRGKGSKGGVDPGVEANPNMPNVRHVELPTTMPVRVQDVTHDVVGSVCVHLTTAYGALPNLPYDAEGQPPEVGAAISARLKLQTRTFGPRAAQLRSAVHMQKNVMALDGFRVIGECDCVLAGIDLVFYRPVSEKILVLQEPHTREGRLLAERVVKSILADEVEVAERFPELPHSAKCRRSSLVELIADLDLRKLSTAEVAAFKALNTIEGYTEALGLSVATVGENLRFLRSQTIPVLEELRSRLADVQGLTQHHLRTFPTTAVAIQRVSGHDNLRLFDETNSMQECVLDYFVRAWTVRPTVPTAVHRTCTSVDGAWFRKLYLVRVPEAMVDATTGLPLGMRTSKTLGRRPPEWVSTTTNGLLGLASRFAEFPSLSETVQELVIAEGDAMELQPQCGTADSKRGIGSRRDQRFRSRQWQS